MLHVPKREFWTSTFLFTSLWSWLDVYKIDFKEQIPWWKWIFCYSTDHWPHKQKYKIHRHLNNAGLRGNWCFNWVFFSSCYWCMPYEICSYLRWWLFIHRYKVCITIYLWNYCKVFHEVKSVGKDPYEMRDITTVSFNAKTIPYRSKSYRFIHWLELVSKPMGSIPCFKRDKLEGRTSVRGLYV